MTVRLLCAYDKYPANAIVTLDAGTEAGLISAKMATATLTGGEVFFVKVVAPAPVPGLVGGGPVSLKGGEQAVCTLPEGQALKVTGGASTAGTVARLDTTGATLQTWTVGTGTLPPIGPFAGTQQFQITCTAGSISAEVGDAVLGAVTPTVSPAGGVTLAIPNSRSVTLPSPTGRKGKILFDFSDTVNWGQVYGGGTLSSSATHQYGAVGLAYTPGSAFDGVKKSFGASTFAIQSGSLLALLVYVPAAALNASNQITIRFSSDNNATKSLSYTITNAYLLNSGWQILYVRAGEDGSQEYQSGGTWTAAGGEVWGNNFNYFQAVFNSYNGGTVVLDSLVVGSRDVPRVVFTFDNIAPSLMSVIAPSLAAYGWSAGLMMDGDTSTVSTNLVNAKTLINTYGWDVGTQGITHTDYQANGRDISADFNTASANFVAAGLPAPTTFAYPLNSSGKATDTALAAIGVTWRRGKGVDIQSNLGFGIPGADDGMVRSGFTQHLAQNFNLGTSYQQIVNRLNRLLLQGGVLSLFTHNESARSTDWGLGGDLTQWYMLLDLLYEYQFRYGLQVIKPSQVKPILQSAVFV